MKSHILTALFLMIPLLFSGSLHMLIVSKRWIHSTAVPISHTYFGRNKTWRGVIAMLLLTIPGVLLAVSVEPLLGDWLSVTMNEQNVIVLGLALGLGYVLAELPNSYVKRRLNIAPGERAKRNAFVFSLVDQADSAVGCALVYWLLLSPPIGVLIWAILLGPIIHMLTNVTLYSIGLRKHAF